jgi:hypothetical protein
MQFYSRILASALLGVIGFSLDASAQVRGDRLLATCTAATGEVKQHRILLRPQSRLSATFATRGDGAWNNRLGRATLQKVMTTNDGKSLHIYALARREMGRQTPLSLRRIGLIAVQNNLRVGTSYVTFGPRDMPLEKGVTIEASVSDRMMGTPFTCVFSVVN